MARLKNICQEVPQGPGTYQLHFETPQQIQRAGMVHLRCNADHAYDALAICLISFGACIRICCHVKYLAETVVLRAKWHHHNRLRSIMVLIITNGWTHLTVMA